MSVNGRNAADETLALHLAKGETVAASAAAANLGARTAFRRMTDPAFRERVRQLRGELIGLAAGKLADGMVGAADKLRTLLQHDDPHVAHKAAAKLLDAGLAVRRQTETELQIGQLSDEVSALTDQLKDGLRPGPSEGGTHA